MADWRSHPFDDGVSALADGPAMGQGAGQFLFHGQEESRSQGEGGDPQAGDRLHGLVATERDLGHLQEQVAGDPGHEEADADRNRALGKRCSPEA